VLFVGDDWAEDHHDVELVDDAGRRLAPARLAEGLEGVSRLPALIGEHGSDEWVDLEPEEAARRVVVGIETDRGPWVQALLAAGPCCALRRCGNRARCRRPTPPS